LGTNAALERWFHAGDFDRETSMTNAAAQPTLASTGVAQAIAPHLPYLRRYARALTGSQHRGDAYVAATLEAVIADRSIVDLSKGPRVGVYRAFQRVWESTDTLLVPTEGEEPAQRERTAQERLDRLTPRSRQALLLTAVESFTPDEAAAVMGSDLAEVSVLIEEAVAELRRQTRARVLIIEDEPIIAMDIESIVVEMGHAVTEIADTRAGAVAAAMADRPDLVLADIQLADGSSGIDAVRDILTAFSAPVIFITAYPQRLLTGERPEPTFLISKPFQIETLQAAISQALFFREAAELV
jgi:DNA-directed RNA polymerase specialized sigma24 family protein/CheY-like chemotaxis protein